MRLETVADLFFVISVFVPGFIYNGILTNFIPLHRTKLKEQYVLRLLTITAFNYALCSPLIYQILFNPAFRQGSLLQSLAVFATIFLVPIALALGRAMMLRGRRENPIYRLLGLRQINPVPTGWDWIFSRIHPCYLIVTLRDGTEIAGYFGSDSMASSDPERKDIYLERVFKVPPNGGEWIPVERSLGIQIDGAQIAFIEFRE